MAQKNAYLFRGRISERKFRDFLRVFALDITADRAAALERFIVARPVPRPVGRRCRSAHADQLPRWIHEMNPSRDLCNRAGQRQSSFCEGPVLTLS